MANGRTGERGAALLLVTVAVAVLTALAVDLAYDARVTLRIAANGRDELRAMYAAKSGVGLARIVLSLQKQIDDRLGGTAAVGAPRPILWRLVPVDSDLASGLFEGEPEGAPLRFHARIDDESSKVNAQLDSLGQGELAAQLQALYRLICDARWDAIFDREDEKGNRVSRADLLVYLHDWIDGVDDDASQLGAQFPMGTCEIVMTRADPFERGGGDKNQPYDRGTDRYRTKNARMDSLDELYLVAGVTDAFMAAFGDSLTVYLPRSTKRNVNETDRDRLVGLARSIAASPPIQPQLQDPAFADALQKAMMQRTFGGVLGLSSSEFAAIVAGLGVTLDPTATVAEKSPLTDRSNVYRIRSEATSGAVTKTLDVVVRMDKSAAAATAGAAAAANIPGMPSLGLPVHWREE